MKCEICGNDLGIFKVKKSNGTTKYKWFSDKPYLLYGNEYYRKKCNKCIEDLLGRPPKSANIFNTDYKIILDIPTHIFDKKYKEQYGYTKEKLIAKYGKKEGIKRWNSYREKQAYSNGLEYKKEKYGWTEEKFDEYNKSRAVTKNKQIVKYGEEEGIKRWNSYREKQAYTNSLEYFIKKYGDNDGPKKWESVNKSKSNNLENYIKRYGEENGYKKWITLIENRSNSLYYSKVSQDLFWNILEKIKHNNWKVYFKEYNTEFLLRKNNNVMFLDFVVLKDSEYKIKKCIEFNGDYWHCNPTMYEKNDIINYPGKGKIKVSDIWTRDSKKLKQINDDNFNIMIVWENEYYNDKEKIIDECVKFLEM